MRYSWRHNSISVFVTTEISDFAAIGATNLETVEFADLDILIDVFGVYFIFAVIADRYHDFIDCYTTLGS